MKKLYIGYDLGDGETIINFVLHDSELPAIDLRPEDVEMPGEKEPGRAVPTVFARSINSEGIVFSAQIEEDSESVKDIHANFKRRPSDLVIGDEKSIIKVFSAESRDWPEAELAQGKDLITFRNSVVDFTNAIFTHNDKLINQFKMKIDKFGDIEQIVVCVGHPTKWNELDRIIYTKILQQSILGDVRYMGYPLKLVVAGESRAAFLYVRDSSTERSKLNDMVLLIDVGSSTVDVTAVKRTEKNNAYNSGHNYLGARIIDYLIYDWYVDKLKENEQYAELEEISKNNPNLLKALLISCRMAKERMYGQDTEQVKIQFANFRPQRITRAELDGLLDKPISDVLKNHLMMNEAIVESVGEKSWKEELRSFLDEQKRIIEEKHYSIENIILTGSASKMPAVKDIAQEVFQLDVLSDNEPAKTISKGLAIVGYSNDKSLQFQKEAEDFLANDIRAIVDDDLPEYAENIAEIMTKYICDDVVIPKLYAWRRGDFTTVQDAVDSIQQECNEENLTSFMSESEDCKQATQNWLREKVGKDIANKLKMLCENYNIKGFTIDDLNVLDFSAGDNIIGGRFDKELSDDLLSPADFLINIISVITGILVFTVTPYIIGAIAGILIMVTNTIGFLLFDLLLAVPGVGWTILLGIAGITAAKAARGQLKGMRNALSAKITTANIPITFRKTISGKKLESSINGQRYTIKEKIKEAMVEESSKQKIIDGINDALSKQVDAVLEDLKYIIESE